MVKCEKCGREYSVFHVKNNPQPKQRCPRCDKDENQKNQRKFVKDTFERTTGSKPMN